jgi:N-acetylglucosamine-6-phosphate deacetylase
MEFNEKFLIKNVQIVKPLRLLQGDLGLENGVITYIGEPVRPPAGCRVIDAAGLYAVPGFIDIHTHGACLFDLTQGLYDPGSCTFDDSDEAYATGIERTMQAMAVEGSTFVLLATVASPIDKLTHALRSAARYIGSDDNGHRGACLGGVLLEGTFIRHPDFAGAQNPEHFLTPSVETFERLNDAAHGNIAYVNCVPEYGEEARLLMEHLTHRRVLIGAGHTDASAEQYAEAVKWGLRVAIHFTNGPTGSTFKPFGGGGVLQAVLGSRKVYAEIIADGYHVSPSYVLDILWRKGTDRVIAITDSMFVTGADEVDQFELAGVRGQRSENGRYLAVAGKRRTLFGSVLTMRVAFANFVSWLTQPMRGIWRDVHDPLELDEAILAASHFCSVNPARAMEIFDPPNQKLGQDISRCTGGIQVGKRADVLLLRVQGEPGQYDCQVVNTFVGGRLVKQAG